jgi:hypothetical protein
MNSLRSALAYAEPLITTMDPVAVRLLHKIVDRSKAKIVVSSTWRLWEDWETCIWGCLRQGGWPSEGQYPIIGRTPRLNNVPRGLEIQTWLNDHPEVESYIILDDDSDMLEEQKPFFVHTNFNVGLGADEWKQIAKIWPEIKEKNLQALSRLENDDAQN